MDIVVASFALGRGKKIAIQSTKVSAFSIRSLPTVQWRLLSKLNWKIPWTHFSHGKGCGCVSLERGGVRRTLAGGEGEGWSGPVMSGEGGWGAGSFGSIRRRRVVPCPLLPPTNLHRPYVFRRHSLFFYSSH